MSALTFIGSAGMQMITGAHRVLREVGGTLALIHPAPAVARVLALLGVDKLIHVYDNTAEALTSAR